MTQQEYEQTFEAGRRARQAGKSRDAGPMYAMVMDGQVKREAWRDGWDAEDQQRSKRA